MSRRLHSLLDFFLLLFIISPLSLCQGAVTITPEYACTGDSVTVQCILTPPAPGDTFNSSVARFVVGSSETSHSLSEVNSGTGDPLDRLTAVIDTNSSTDNFLFASLTLNSFNNSDNGLRLGCVGSYISHGGGSAQETQGAANLKAAVPPSTPTKVVIYISTLPTNCTNRIIYWTAPASNRDVERYYVYRNSTLLTVTTDTLYTDRDQLLVNTLYQYSVIANSCAGNSTEGIGNSIIISGNCISFLPDVPHCIGDTVELLCSVVPPTGQIFIVSTALMSFNESATATPTNINNNSVSGVDLSRYSADTVGLNISTESAGIRLNITNYQPSDANTLFGCHGLFNDSTPSAALISGYPQTLAAPPSTPTVSSLSTDCTKRLISWTAPASDRDIERYYVYRNSTLLAVTTGTLYIDRDQLLVNTLYQYSVIANSCAGNSTEGIATVAIKGNPTNTTNTTVSSVPNIQAAVIGGIIGGVIAIILLSVATITVLIITAVLCQKKRKRYSKFSPQKQEEDIVNDVERYEEPDREPDLYTQVNKKPKQTELVYADLDLVTDHSKGINNVNRADEDTLYLAVMPTVDGPNK